MLKPDLLTGRMVRLTAVSKEDLPVMARWWSDVDFLRRYDAVPAAPKNEAQLAKRIENAHADSSTFLFGIRLLAEERLIGILEFDGVLWSHGTSYISIAIGDAADRGQGYGYEAMQLALTYAFNELNLHRVFLTVFSYNKPAIYLYEKLGFHCEGTYREHLKRDGERHDMLLYGLLSREWDRNARPD